MHYPKLRNQQPFFENKIGFSVLAAAVLMNLLKKQRDAVGLSVYSDKYEYYAPEKGSDRHHRMILHQLEGLISSDNTTKTTDTVTYLHQIAENLHRRSMVILFTDMFQNEDNDKIFKALQHLKHNKHKVVVFHVYDPKTELDFDFDAAPRKFIDIETGETVQLFAENSQDAYQKIMSTYFKTIEATCLQYQIKYIPVAIDETFEKIMTAYLVEKQKFA
jgi:uncharacterized protein (DUF58 family)